MLFARSDFLRQLTDRKVAWFGITVLAIAAALYLVYPLLLLQLHLPRLPNEGWNAQLAAEAIGGGTLYPGREAFLFNNYPPVSFYIVGLAGLAFDDNILAGRIISFASIAVVAVNVALTIRNLGGTALWGALGGVLFVGILTKSYVNYVGTNDPQLLAHAIMTTGFTVLTASPRSVRHVGWAAFLMVLAGFTKHNIVAMPLAVTTWLLQNDRRMLIRWLAFSSVFLLFGFALAGALYGMAFFEQLILPRKYSLYHLLVLLGWLQTIAIPVILWAIFAYQAPAEPRLRLVTHLLVWGAISFAATRIGHNVSINSLFDWIISAAIAAGVMISRINEARMSARFGPTATRALITAALCARMILLPQSQLINLVAGASQWTAQKANDVAFRADVAFMREQAGPALCEISTLCYRSGHNSMYDRVNAPMAFELGVRDIGVLRRQIRAGQYPLIQLYSRSELLGAARGSPLTERTGATNSPIFYRPAP